MVRVVAGCSKRSVTSGSCGQVARVKGRYLASVLTWAITRARDESKALVEQLSARGLRAVALPCIERTLRSLASWRPSGHRVVLLTSVAAVEAVKPVLEASLPADLAALAPSTVAALRPYRATIESSEGVVALAREILESLRSRGIEQASVWYPTSSAGLDAAEQNEAIALLGNVHRVVAYDVVAPVGLADQLRALTPLDLGLFFSSPSAVRHFVDASMGLALSVKEVACWGESTRREAQSHFAHAHSVSRTNPLHESLLALENHHV